MLSSAILIGIFNIYPLWTYYQTARAEEQGIRRLAAELDELALIRQKTLSTIDELPEKDRVALDNTIPTESRKTELVMWFEYSAGRNSIILSSIEFADASAGSGAGAQPRAGRTDPQEKVVARKTRLETVNLDVQGRYEAVKAFMKDIETSLRLLDVEKTTIAASEESPGIINTNITVNFYYQQQK